MRGMGIVLLLCAAGCSASVSPGDRTPVRVFLWGDSTLVFYFSSLEASAGGSAEFWFPEWHYGMTVESLRDRISGEERASLGAYDVFHLNTGLHDSFAEPPVTPAEYEAAWLDVLRVIREENPWAPVVLATSVVPDAGAHDASLVREYNEVIRRIAFDLDGVRLDDLAAVQEEEGLELEDGLHLTPEGSDRLGVAVWEAIEDALR